MLQRTIEEGRAVEAEFMARVHYDAQVNFLRLIAELGHRATFVVWMNDRRPAQMHRLSLEEFRKQSYIEPGNNERPSTSGTTTTGTSQGSRTAEETEALRRLRDQGGDGTGGRLVRRGDEAGRGGVGEEARQGRASESLLGRVGDEAQRKAALRDYVRQQAEAAYREGRINAVQYRGIVPGASLDR